MTAPDVLIPYESTKTFDVKVSRRINILATMRPLLDQANSTCDETVLLNIAAECEKASLYILAAQYRRRAGVRQPRQSRHDRVNRAIEFICQQGSVSTPAIRNFLGLTKHEYVEVLAALRGSPRVVEVNDNFVPVEGTLLLKG